MIGSRALLVLASCIAMVGCAHRAPARETGSTADALRIVLDGHVREFLPCMDGSTLRVEIDFSVSPEGRAKDVTVRQGSDVMKACVEKVVAGISFPELMTDGKPVLWWFEVGY